MFAIEIYGAKYVYNKNNILIASINSRTVMELLPSD